MNDEKRGPGRPRKQPVEAHTDAAPAEAKPAPVDGMKASVTDWIASSEYLTFSPTGRKKKAKRK